MSDSRKNHIIIRVALTVILVGIITSSFVFLAFADTTLFNDQGVSNWAVYNGGSGKLSATISTSTTIVHSGASSSLELSIVSGTSGVVGFYHTFDPLAVWSSYTGLSFWLYGSNSGGYIYFVLFDKTGNYYLVIILDNFAGWKQFTLNFATGLSSGTVNLANIYAMEFSFGNPAPSMLYLDQIVLIGGSSTTSTPTASPTPSPTTSATTSPIASPSPTSSTSSSTPTPTPKGIIFFPPEPTPIAFPSVTPSPVTKKSTPIPGSPINLAVYVVNGSTQVTDGVVALGASSVSLNSSGIAYFSDLVASRLYHLSVVVNGVKVYDDESFVVPASEAFTVNLAAKNSAGISLSVLGGLIIVVAATIIAIVIITIMRSRQAKV